MATTVYVFRLEHSVTGLQLTALFAVHGTVESAQVMMDPATGQSRGFGFVQMSTEAEASAATMALDGTSMAGRTLRVKHAGHSLIANPRKGRLMARTPSDITIV